MPVPPHVLNAILVLCFDRFGLLRGQGNAQAIQECLPSMPFAALGLSPSICSPLARLGYSSPTPVQAQAIPVILAGGDLLARAQTGTGKTAAFGLPLIDRLMVSGRRAGRLAHPRGLVLVPTRELAMQVHKSLSTYGAAAQLRSVVILGGVAMRPQVQALRQGCDVIVATPGRLIDHLQQRTVDLSRVEMLVLDEADRMLDMGFLPALRRVLAALPSERQTLLLSATFSKEVLSLSGQFTRQPVTVDVSDSQVVATTVTHRVHPVADGRKGELLRLLVSEPSTGQTLVFCKTKRGANRVGESLDHSGIRSAVIHGNKSQNARNRALADFKSGRVSVLVATDVAARGLDIPQLPLVVNYDLPLVPEDYVHRVGRTGRAGLAGRAVSLVSSADHGLLAGIQRLLPAPLEQVVVAGFEVSSSDRRPGAVGSGGHHTGRDGRPGARRGGFGQGSRRTLGDGGSRRAPFGNGRESRRPHGRAASHARS
jgi:ATP-dependent RNA helicase RhlE